MARSRAEPLTISLNLAPHPRIAMATMIEAVCSGRSAEQAVANPGREQLPCCGAASVQRYLLATARAIRGPSSRKRPGHDPIIMESVYAAAILAPFVLLTTYLCVRRYNPQTRLLSWRRERPIRSIVLTVFFVAAAAELATLIGLQFGADEPWYEYLWTVYGVAWIAWLLALRAAGVEQHSRSGRP
jgi:hypothetical protein